MKATDIKGKLVANPSNQRDAVARLVREDGTSEDVAVTKPGQTRADFGPLELAPGEWLELGDDGGKSATLSGTGKLDNRDGIAAAEAYVRVGQQETLCKRVAAGAVLPFEFSMHKENSFLEVLVTGPARGVDDAAQAAPVAGKATRKASKARKGRK